MDGHPDNPSDADLVRAVGEGDRAAFGVLVDRHLAGVYAVALRLLRNAAEAEDVAQDSLLRAMERLHQYDPEHSFHNWLLKIATNQSLNRLRSRRRERQMQERLAGQESRRPASSSRPETSPTDWRYWLDQLDEPQRLAIILFHFHQMPYAEVAEILELPINTVRTHLHRGRKRLRELMAQVVHWEDGSWQIATPNV